ncbi:SGNH/GDSL hydrolase family protein [Streptomyces sp. XD-27]|uniref:SGNH/GDSL hydrolase family protein n=1 Tax=Streptomyces sp. XD-27 TaxID=3062779 RepID=UPI0026F47E0B|nr:SGNH/GDSL hydrolase family protein [Streptomyces sp. XD-27]WKX70156.1 SGNH/GDSL hydrolase family protein [Streptomyces sp. XD-27]
MRGSYGRDRRRRPATGTTATTAGALFAAAALLAGCTLGSGGGDGDGGSERAVKRPAPRATPSWDTRPRSLASVGDSISRGFDACSVLKDCPEVSWATGTEVDSLARRLRPSGGGEVRSWNHAKTGALMADLPAQMRAATAHEPELVTVLIGANDACRDSVDDMTPTADFRADFTTALTSLRRALPKTQVYVASVPDLKRLWSQGRNNLFGRQVWKLGICPSMLKDSTADDAASVERRRQVEDRVDAYNAALKDVCGKDPRCRYDDAVHNYRFTTDELSKWDWFHPSKEGQQALADMAYRTITRKEPAA